MKYIITWVVILIGVALYGFAYGEEPEEPLITYGMVTDSNTKVTIDEAIQDALEKLKGPEKPKYQQFEVPFCMRNRLTDTLSCLVCHNKDGSLQGPRK